MIERLSIKNFKSIKDLEIECKKINLFIGEPNTGKSNILEALGLLSWCGYMNRKLKEYIRFKDTPDLFYDELLENKIEIGITGEVKGNIMIDFHRDIFYFFSKKLIEDPKVQNKEDVQICRLNSNGKISEGKNVPSLQFLKFYKYREQDRYNDYHASYLMPPDGENLFSTVMAKKKLRQIMNRYFNDYGMQLVARKIEKTFEFQKSGEDFPVTYPLILCSDTIKRMIFHEIAMESNNDSILVFEEPEVHSFPDYLTILGESIGMDKTNQYFIVTHSPYLLLSILEKAMKNSVNVFITYWDNYETKVKCISDDKLQDLFTYDPFFNLRLHIEDED